MARMGLSTPWAARWPKKWGKIPSQIRIEHIIMPFSDATIETLATAKAAYRKGLTGWTAAHADAFDYFLGVLPPISIRLGGFAVGEAFDHNSKGEPVYLCFRGQRGMAPSDSDSLECRYCTLAEFHAEVPAAPRLKAQR